MGETFFDEAMPGLTVKDAILAGKSVAVHCCSFRGHDHSACDHVGHGAPFDMFMEMLGGPKWRTVGVLRNPPRPDTTSQDFMRDFDPDPNVRALVRSFVPAKYHAYYDGSRINTDISLGGVLALREKMLGVVGDDGRIIDRLCVPHDVWCAIRCCFWEFLGLAEANIPFVMTEATLRHDYFRSSAAYGFDGSKYRPTTTKGPMVDVNGERCVWIANQVLHGSNFEDVTAPWGHITGLKPEIFGPDVPLEKVRFIFQQNMECGAFTKHFTIPIQEFLESRIWYMPGKSLMGEQYPYLLQALSHPDASSFYPDVQWRGDLDHFVLLDLKGQDWSYVPEVLVFLVSSVCNLIKTPEYYANFVVKLSAYIQAWTDCKFVQAWGKEWKYALGMFASGSDWTTIVDTCEMLLVVLITLFTHLGFDPTILREIRFVAYGDDFAMSMTRSMYGRLFPDGDVVGFCRSAKASCGAVFKPEQTVVLAPLPSHKDRFFTYVVRDADGHERIESDGFCMLKRRWVKYDSNLAPLHPDTPMCLVKCVLPWRPTIDIVPKVGLDVKNWANKDRPWVAWYKKAFGLLIDSVANKESHDMLITGMEWVRDIFPDQADEAETTFSWKLTDDRFKLGSELDDGLIKIIPRAPNSIRLVAALFLSTPAKVWGMYSSGINKDLVTILQSS